MHSIQPCTDDDDDVGNSRTSDIVGTFCRYKHVHSSLHRWRCREFPNVRHSGDIL